jgi:hypothetical protein
MYIAPEQLDSLRTLLIIGWALTGLLYVLQNWEEWTKPKAAPVQHCQLHRCPLPQCVSQHEEIE